MSRNDVWLEPVGGVSPTNDSSRVLYLFFFFLARMQELHHSSGPDLYRITASL